MEIKLIAASKDDSQFSKQFLQGMINRMIVGGAKYGSIGEKQLAQKDNIASLKQRLDKYALTGNTEWLMDAANFAMMEFMFPKHPDAHYRGTDHNESPGYLTVDGESRKL